MASFDLERFVDDGETEPRRRIAGRDSTRVIPFGAGPHKCAGMPFARMMLRIAIEEALNALGEFEITDESAVLWEVAQVRICTALPVTHQPRS